MEDFITANQVRIGEDFVDQPIYYYSLLSTLRHYFGTYESLKNKIHFNFDFKNNSREKLSRVHSDIYNVKHAISCCQNFFELFFKHNLEKHLPGDEVVSMNFPTKLNKVKELSETSMDFHRYEFLRSQTSLDFLINLNRLRNKMVHDACLSINIHAMDYLMSQYAIPIIHEIILSDIDSKELSSDFRYLTTSNGLHILSEITKIKFQSSWYEDEQKHELLQLKLVHLAHLKEIGRANVYRTTIKHSDERSFDFNDTKYLNPHLRNENFSKLEQDRDDFYARKECPCCGVNSLVIYQHPIKNPFNERMEMIEWFRCYTCTYNGGDNMGDPGYFGICDEPLLPVIERS